MSNAESVWARIQAHASAVFHTSTGLPFTYEVPGNYLRVSRTNRNLARSNFTAALDHMPADGPGDLKQSQGASYTWAILMDPRIRREGWE